MPLHCKKCDNVVVFFIQREIMKHYSVQNVQFKTFHIKILSSMVFLKTDLQVESSDWPAPRLTVFKWAAQSSISVKTVHVSCCTPVCSLSPSCVPPRPAASTKRTHPRSAPGSPLWTRCTRTPAQKQQLWLIRFMFQAQITSCEETMSPSDLLEVQLLEHGDADLVVQTNFGLKLFDSEFVDSW